MDVGEDFVFLVIEVLCGEGVMFINKDGECFMFLVYFDVEFVLCDIVVCVVFVQYQVGNCLMFDMCEVIGVEIIDFFFFVVEYCVCNGIDLLMQLIFVVFVVYYYMGGIVIDVEGCVSFGNFWVCGEVSLMGLYGFNCLVFNGLFEVLVYVCICVEGIKVQMKEV